MCILSYVDGVEEQERLDLEDVIIDELDHHPPTVEMGTPVIATTLKRTTMEYTEMNLCIYCC